jgi:hypothetical protein
MTLGRLKACFSDPLRVWVAVTDLTETDGNPKPLIARLLAPAHRLMLPAEFGRWFR